MSQRTLIVLDDGQAAEQSGLLVIRDGVGRRFGAPRNYKHVLLSPDGTHLGAINAVLGDETRNELRIVDMETEDEVVVPLGTQQYVQWASDSSALAVYGSEVVLFSPTGGVLARRAGQLNERGTPAAGAFFGWSPDSTEYAFRNGDLIEIVEANTGNVQSGVLSTLLADYGTPSPNLNLWYWTSEVDVLLVEFPDEGIRLEDQQVFLVDRSFDPSLVRKLDTTDDAPIPSFFPYRDSRDGVNATATALRSLISDEDAEGAGVASNWRAQLYRGRPPGKLLYVQEFSTGEVLELDIPEFGHVAGDEFMSVYVAPP